MNPTLQTIHSLRTIHGDFSERNITDADVEMILQAGVRAATASGRQSYSIIVLDDRDVMQNLLGCAGSRALVFCVDFTRLVDLAERLGYAFDPIEMQNYVTGATDTVLAAQTAVIAAKSLGIDSLITNATHRGDGERFHKALNLPSRYCVPQLAVVLGYPRSEPSHRRGRLSGTGVVHRGHHQRMTTEQVDAMVDSYDSADPQMGLTADWKQEGCNHYLDWFFGVWWGCPKKGEGDAPVHTGSIEQLLELAGYLVNQRSES